MTPRDRVRALMAEENITSAVDAAKTYGLGYEATKKLLNGRRPMNPAQALRIGRHHHVPAAWLLFGDTPPAPLIGKIGAGQRVYPFDGDTRRTTTPVISHEDTYAFIVEGESMLPLARPGDHVFFGPERRDLKALIGCECVVTLEDGSRMFKRLEQGSRAGLFDLVSYNAEPMRDQQVHSAGVFLGLRRAAGKQPKTR